MRIAVVGAGFSGLVSLKCCLDEKLDAVCFEREGYIGGLWNYSEDGKKGTVIGSTVINSSRDMMAISDFPISEDHSTFMHNSDVLAYAHAYAEEFDLMKHIRFNTAVTSITKSKDHLSTGKWVITYKSVIGINTNPITEVFDAVLACAGHHWKENYPNFPGMKQFEGLQMHSKGYYNAEKLKNKSVLLIGLGNSAADIAVDLCHFAKKVYVSTRRGGWIFSRFLRGLPRDKLMNRRYFYYCIPKLIKVWLAKYLLTTKINTKSTESPTHNVYSQHPGVNEQLPTLVKSGDVIIKPNVTKIMKNSVEFTDGSVMENVDCIIYCTGFKFGFPFIDKEVLNIVDNQLPCYKYVFPVNLEKSTLAVIGFIQPLGSIIPVSEMQSRFALKVFTKKFDLPPKDEMEKEVRKRNVKMQQTYYSSLRHTIQVDFISYMDDLAKMIGCKPSFCDLLFNDPRLWFHFYFGACISSQYRLCGPESWSHARDEVINTGCKRYGSNTSLDKNSSIGRPHLFICLLAIACAILYLGICPALFQLDLLT